MQTLLEYLDGHCVDFSSFINNKIIDDVMMELETET